MVIGSVDRFDVYLVALDPTVGSQIQKTCPCLIVSPDEMNHAIATVIVVPMATRGPSYPTRLACLFEEREAQIILDQLHTVDKARLVRRLGHVSGEVQETVLSTLAEMFAP